MNIIWVSTEPLLPANTGGRLGSLKRLERICEKHNVYMFFPYDEQEDFIATEKLRYTCTEVHGYPRGKSISSLIVSLFIPFTVASRRISAMRTDIMRCAQQNKINVLIIDYPHMLTNLNRKMRIYGLPIILNEHNLEWKAYAGIAAAKKNILMRVLYLFDSYRLKAYEGNIIRQLNIDKYTFVSDSNMREYCKTFGISADACVHIPCGADALAAPTLTKPTTANIIFVGKMAYAPNEDGALWFAECIFPRICESFPSAKLYLVGKDPGEALLRLRSDRIIVTGTVESVEPYYDLADIVILPLRHGDGVKIKLLEAIGHGKRVVSTSKGVEGTAYAANGMLPVSDEAGIFAAYCIAALKGETPGNADYQAAYYFFLHKYTWDAIGEKYLRVIDSITEVIKNENE